MKRLADFYIIGAMKCATSTLHEQLARREAFFMSEPKEPNFFNDERLHSTGFADYQRLFDSAQPGQICGESSTHYTKRPTYQQTAERIAEQTPEARFVYVMRDPVDRIVSHYIHEWTEGRTRSDISTEVLQNVEYVAYSDYAMQLEPFVRIFGRERILPVFFEFLVKNREKELERVARFVGDTSDEPFRWYQEAGQTNVSKDRLKKSRVREAVLAVDALRRIKDALPVSVKERIKSVWRMSERPQLSEEARAELVARLDPTLARLGQDFGVSLSCDNFKQVAAKTQPVFRSASET